MGLGLHGGGLASALFFTRHGARVTVTDNRENPEVFAQTIPRLEEAGVDGADLDRIEAEARAEVDDATEKTRNAPPPAPETMMTELWADGGSEWRN